MSNLRAGALNRRITLQSRSTGQDTSGGQLLTWTDVATVWAQVEPLNGRELLAAQAVQSSVSHQITIRYQIQFADPKVMAKMRAKLVKDSVTRYFNIHAARDEGELRQVIIMDAEEGLNAG
jgi:SPP1 family predicted phage head-tail adaptor